MGVTFSGGSNALRSEQGAPDLQQKVELVSDITVSSCLVMILITDSHTAFILQYETEDVSIWE